MDWTILFGGLGVGSLLGIIAQNYFSRKAAKEERFYQEKKETYLGLLDAIHRAAVSSSDANSKKLCLVANQSRSFRLRRRRNSSTGNH